MNASQMLNSSLNEKFFGYNLKVLKKDNVNRISFSHKNIKSIWNKFDIHSKAMLILLGFFETKIKDSQPTE